MPQAAAAADCGGVLSRANAARMDSRVGSAGGSASTAAGSAPIAGPSSGIAPGCGGELAGARAVEVSGHVADVRRRHHVVQRAEGMADRQWFDVEHDDVLR